MPIPTNASVESVEFDFGGLGKLKVSAEDDAGTPRVVVRFNNSPVLDVTPAGGHVEQRNNPTLPAGYVVV